MKPIRKINLVKVNKTQIMKPKIFPLIFLISTFTFGQNKTIKINHQDFELKILKSEDSLLKTLEISRDNGKILTHTLYQEDGDCSSIQIEIGNYEVKNNQIIFYSYWAAADLQGLLSYPFGFRKQIYSVNNEGKLRLRNSEIYIEDKIGNIENDIVLPLKSNPKTKAEKELLAKYINAIEQKHNTKFVMGIEKAALEKEVRKSLEKEIQTATKDWKTTYGSRAKF